MDQRIRKLMAMSKALPPKDDTDCIYQEKKEEEESKFDFCLVLWHINHYRLFKAKSFLYIYIKHIISKHIL